MSVTPEQKSVILKNENHYITDDNGKVFVKNPCLWSSSN